MITLYQLSNESVKHRLSFLRRPANRREETFIQLLRVLYVEVVFGPF